MDVYTLVLFAHVVGAIGYCISIGAWLLLLVGLRRAQRVEEARALMRVNDLSGPIGAASALLLLIAGLYLALTAWSLLAGWILVALISLLVMLPTVAALIAPRRSAIVKQLAQEAPEGAISPDLRQRLHDPVLLAVVLTVAVLLVGLILLMTTKPDLVGSIIVMFVALLLGLASSAVVTRAGQTQVAEGAAPADQPGSPAG
jgi:hypothetical protein